MQKFSNPQFEKLQSGLLKGIYFYEKLWIALSEISKTSTP